MQLIRISRGLKLCGAIALNQKALLQKMIVSKIQQNMILHKILLLHKVHYRQGFQLFEMRPAIIINFFQLIITALRKKAANSHMH